MDLFAIDYDEVINLDNIVRCTREKLPDEPGDVTLHFADGTRRTFGVGREADTIWNMFWNNETDSLMQRIKDAEARQRSLQQRPDDDIPF